MSSTSATTPAATPIKKEKDISAASPAPPSLVTNSSRVPSTSYSSATSLSASFEPLSSSEILERVPSPVVRLAAALAPAIHAFHRFIRLATWTGGKNSTSSSVLLLVSFWLTCAFGYELLRYAPQTLVLGWIAYAGVRRQLSFARPRKHTPAKIIEKHDVVSAASLNATLLELSELADFFSSLRRNVLVPAVQLVSWDPSPMSTKAVAAFVLLTWPLWLLAFLPLRESGFPSLVLPVSARGIVAAIVRWDVYVYHQILELIGPDHVAAFHTRAAPLYAHCDHLSAFVARTPVPIVYAHLAHLASRVRWEQWTEFNLTLLPPYPIGALTVRSLICFVGTLALTWCSPWCSLFRQAVWKSATIRRVVRGTGRLLSGQFSARDAYGKGNLDDEWAHGLYHEDGSELLSAAGKGKSDAGLKGKGKADGKEDKVVRHEDVVYEFSIFENQRWWVGLDWTAALLPQERPSWSDEANNPVSPPASFSLPATKIMLTPAPTAADPKAFTRRTIKWQWVDPEWSIAGVSSRGYYPSSAVYKGSAKEAAIKSASALGDNEAVAAAKQGYLGDALSRIRARTSGKEEEEVGDVGTTAHRVGAEGGEEEWDVDAEGWQYGDNAWDKMSRKSGMGRYTRRRKWVRRAVLLEVVEYGVHGPTAGDKVKGAVKEEGQKEDDGEKEEEEKKVDGVDSSTTPKVDTDVVAASTTEPGEKEEEEDFSPSSAALAAKRPSISDRLAKAAQ